ncbi:MAG: hypothetical protein K2X38_11135 [Gemmataceae bacterium]|nr:hypothetical protein [Gemmataceae bacterium]
MIRTLATLFLILGLTFAVTQPALACPLCKDAIATPDGAEDEDVAALPKAYNRSIMLMLIVPYVSLVGVGFLIYRGVKKNAAYLERMRQLAADTSANPQAV